MAVWEAAKVEVARVEEMGAVTAAAGMVVARDAEGTEEVVRVEPTRVEGMVASGEGGGICAVV